MKGMGGVYKAKEGGGEEATRIRGWGWGGERKLGHTLKMKTQHEINLAKWNLME